MSDNSQNIAQSSSNRAAHLILSGVFGALGWVYTLTIFLGVCGVVSLGLGYFFWLWALNSAADQSTTGLTLDMASWHYYIEMIKPQFYKYFK